MGEGIIQDVERYGVIMFVSFSVGNTGPFKEITGITTLAENLKKEFLEENTFKSLDRTIIKFHTFMEQMVLEKQIIWQHLRKCRR